MAKSIALQGIAGRAGVGRRQVAGRIGQADVGSVQTFPPGIFSFSPPKAGYWKFVLWGAGDGSNGGGASGGYAEKTLFLDPSQAARLVVGSRAAGGPGGASTATFPDGQVVTCGGGNAATPGIGSGGNVNLAGSAPGAAGLGTGGGIAHTGAGAPANLPYRGGAGGSSPTTGSGGTPGAGSIGAGQYPGGDGLIIVSFVRD